MESPARDLQFSGLGAGANKVKEGWKKKENPGMYHAIIRAMSEINGSHADDTVCSMICILIKPSIVAIFLR